MYLRALPLAIAAAVVFSACASGTTYPTGRSDDKYDLEAMSLTDEDLPAGYAEVNSGTFTNEEWANVLDEQNPDAKQNQLEAQGRVRSAAKIFSWDSPGEHLGQLYQIAVQNTLFVSARAASDSLKKLCDLPIDEKNPLTEFKVSGVGEESTGFQVTETIQNFGASVDTAICFRTGRIVHAVVTSGLQGTENVKLAVQLAEKLMTRVDSGYKASP